MTNTITDPVHSLKKLMIIDDEENMLHMLNALLVRYGYSITLQENPRKALELLTKNNFNFILCDVRMPEMDGLEFLKKAMSINSNLTVIMMSAYGNIDLAVDAMKLGAYDFVSKPFKQDEVLLTLKKAEERELLRRENHVLRKEVKRVVRKEPFSKIVGKSTSLVKVLDLAKKISNYSTTVLITGESGTGKELLAQGIHKLSSRKDRPILAINCGSIPSELLESELFGYVKGAFTGADRNKKGLFEEADGSTLFLDEIGELTLAMQVKLLRTLQESEVRPIGSNINKKIDVRILAATAKILSAEVEAGRFRQDLYYRLNVVCTELPPLRWRLEDISLLSDHFIQKFNSIYNKETSGISSSAISIMMNYHWPGNVRELENAIQRGVILTDSGIIEPEHLPEAISKISNKKYDGSLFDGIDSLKEAQKLLEEKLIEKVLIKTEGNKSVAAKILEVSYPSLLKKIKEYEI